MNKKRFYLFLFLAAAVLSLLIGIAAGSVAITPEEIARILGEKLFSIPLPEDFDRIKIGLLWNIRLPRVFLAFLVGAALAVSGSVMQSVLNNPLASPYGLGISAGAGLGTACLLVCGFGSGLLGNLLFPAVGLAAGLATVVGVTAFSTRIDRNLSNHTIVLTGMVFSLFLNAVMTTLASAAPAYSQRITLWQLGSLSMKSWSQVLILCPVVLAAVLLFLYQSRELDLMAFGELQALSAGMELKKKKWLFLVAAAVLTGTTVAFVGIIGFIDMIAPHIVRRYFGASHRYVIPLSALFGGSFLVLADIAARTLVSPSEIPIGSITALVGAPFFVFVFLKTRK